MTLLLADDRTEVDDEEYFQTLGEKEDDDDGGCSTKKKIPKRRGGGSLHSQPILFFDWSNLNTIQNYEIPKGIWAFGKRENVYKKDDHIHVCETVSRWQHIVCAGPKERGKV